jgi:uracil-DNA glycosylase family 4
VYLRWPIPAFDKWPKPFVSTNNSDRTAALQILNDRIISCRKCPRLVEYREAVAREKRRAFLHCEYWGRPVPGFGDARAQLLILGLAPAAHGGNRTGRVFTGDRSGDFLYRHLYEAGFASQPISTDRGDGLTLRNAYVAAAVRCAPPANRPLPSEIANCRPYLESELELLRPRAVLALGALAFNTYLNVLKDRGAIRSRAQFPFRHGAAYDLAEAGLPAGDLPVGTTRLFASYHPSQQNTFTGTLTDAMFRRLLRQIARFLGAAKPGGPWRRVERQSRD